MLNPHPFERCFISWAKNLKEDGILERVTAIASKIVEKEGDYILAVKGNQDSWAEEVHTPCKYNRPVLDTCIVEKGHGRIETRRCEVFEKGLIVEFENWWKKRNSVIKITSICEFANKTETQE